MRAARAQALEQVLTQYFVQILLAAAHVLIAVHLTAAMDLSANNLISLPLTSSVANKGAMSTQTAAVTGTVPFFSSVHPPTYAASAKFVPGTLLSQSIATSATDAVVARSQYSASMWFLAESWNKTIVTVKDSLGENRPFRLQLNATGMLVASIGYSGGAWSAEITSNTVVHRWVWNFIAYTVSSSNVVTLYVNGAVVGSATLSSSQSVGLRCITCTSLVIGGAQAGAGIDAGFWGYVAGVNLYDTALTQSLVYATYRSTFDALSSPQCPDGSWSYYADDSGVEGRDSCYRIAASAPTSWQSAATSCPVGSHLLTITSSERRTGIFSAVLSHITALNLAGSSIGCNQSASATITWSGWSWVDGTPASQLNCNSTAAPGCGLWSGGQPDERGNPETHTQDCCVILALGGMDDSTCGQQVSYVCEYDVPKGEQLAVFTLLVRC